MTSVAVKFAQLNAKGRIALGFIAILVILGFTAELWSNSRPLLLQFHGHWYFPAVVNYRPSDLGLPDSAVIDYRSLELTAQDCVVWPLIKWDPFETNTKITTSFPAPPSAENWLGTDDRGRDILARLLYGIRYSLLYAFLTWVTCSFVGVIAGSLMGYAGGWIDLIGQRVIEVFESVPQLLLLITVVSVFNASLPLLVLFTTFFGWISVSLYFRGEFLRLKKQDFAQAALASGARKSQVILRHLLPNSLTPWLTLSPFMISGAIASLAALDFLGFGLPAPTPSWGELLNQAYANFTNAWWLALFPSATIFITLVLFNLLGEALRELFDVRAQDSAHV